MQPVVVVSEVVVLLVSEVVSLVVVSLVEVVVVVSVVPAVVVVLSVAVVSVVVVVGVLSVAGQGLSSMKRGRAWNCVLARARAFCEIRAVGFRGLCLAYEDVKKDPTRSFEIVGHEESALLPRHDKFLLWAHDISHNRWGGKLAADDPKTAANISHYVPAFLRWQILENGDSSDRQRFMDLLHFDRNTVTLDPSLDGTGFWANTSPEDADLDSPVIFGDFAHGLKGDSHKRLQIDNMLRASPDACISAVSPASSSKVVTTTGFSNGQVCMGSSQNLTLPIPMGSADTWHRETSAMRVRWGDLESGGTIQWAVDESLREYSFLSLRAGQINHASPPTMTTMSVGLKTPSGMVSQAFPVDVDLYTQDDFSVTVGAHTSQTVNFMRSIRIPLSAFCDQGADISDVEAVVITFPNDVDSRTVLLDSIEFTKADDEKDMGQCL
ncbi:hypothetical protein [Nannocystis pusilla]|uniref:Uncharacterized protein n=1 Tax=Nannocystis pusilla TaxID=889268 RepID=A0ABS7U2N7_9BACT|nr:hypothetical protein [Nannocystis pusilla]MBZ5714709.1 hypothetical protein [Nannocystis pusilla]